MLREVNKNIAYIYYPYYLYVLNFFNNIDINYHKKK